MVASTLRGVSRDRMSRFHVVQGSGRNAFLSPRRIRVSCNNQARTVSYNCTPGILCGYIHVKLFEKGRSVPFHTILMLFCYVHLPSQSHGLFHGSLPSLSDTPPPHPKISLVSPSSFRSVRDLIDRKGFESRRFGKRHRWEGRGDASDPRSISVLRRVGIFFCGIASRAPWRVKDPKNASKIEI